jgi:regulation of enolase protein 1 (concanavalin A-like superfamily)
MQKNLLLLLLILLLPAGLLSAKQKAVPLKKFLQADIGNPALPGKSEVREDEMSILAGGADIWGTRDEFHFSFFEQTGDFDFACRVESLSAPHLYTKAGLMVREELSENSRHIFFQVFPDNKSRNKNNGGYEFQYRQQKGGEMKAIYPPKAEGIPDFPVNYPDTWIRLERKGNEFRGFWSADGKTWKLYTTFNLELPEKVFLGLAVTSHNKSESATAVFKDVSIKNPGK